MVKSMSKHHLFEYKFEEEPGGKRKRALTVNGFWIVVLTLIFVAAVYQSVPREIPDIIIRFLGR
jgi:hypothetical protein